MFQASEGTKANGKFIQTKVRAHELASGNFLSGRGQAPTGLPRLLSPILDPGRAINRGLPASTSQDGEKGKKADGKIQVQTWSCGLKTAMVRLLGYTRGALAGVWSLLTHS